MASQPLYIRIRDRLRADYLSASDGREPLRLPTERELQRQYGVSRPTIAKALAALAADGELVSERGRGRYVVPRQDAPTTRRIGYVASIATEVLTQRTYFGVEREARRRGYRVVMANAQNKVSHEREAVQDLMASGVAGLVIYPVPRPANLDEDDYLVQEDLGIPVVVVDTGCEACPHPQFLFDNEQLGYDVATWLVHQGHCAVAYAIGDAGIVHLPLAERLRGVRRAFQDHRIGSDMLHEIHYDGGAEGILRRVAEQILDHRPQPSAVIATEDRSAAELADALADLGVRVPDDIVVVGFDDLLQPWRRAHAWPTSRPDFQKLGERACRCLLDIVEGASPRPRTYVFEVPFVVRRASESHTRARDLRPAAASMDRLP